MERLADNALDRAHTRFIVSADPQEVADKIKPYIDLGFTELVFHFPGNDQKRYIDEFADRRLPAAADDASRSSTRASSALRQDDRAELDHLYDGCRWAEGPAYFPAHRALVWSDIPNDRMLRYDEATGQRRRVPRRPRATPTATRSTPQGRLVSCEHGNRRVTRTEHDGTITVLADAFDGKRLNSPNDVVVRSRRRGLLHRPRATGSRAGTRATRPSAEFERRATSSGSTRSRARCSVVADDFDRPNGLAFSARRAAAVRHRQRRTAAT